MKRLEKALINTVMVFLGCMLIAAVGAPFLPVFIFALLCSGTVFFATLFTEIED